MSNNKYKILTVMKGKENAYMISISTNKKLPEAAQMKGNFSHKCQEFMYEAFDHAMENRNFQLSYNK